MTQTPIDIPALEALLKANETYTRPFTGPDDPAPYLVRAVPNLIKAVEERDEWKRKYTAIVIGADPKASGTAKTYWAAVERACDEALTGYKHEAREAQSALASLRALLAEARATMRDAAQTLRQVPRDSGVGSIAWKDAVELELRCASIQSALREIPTSDAKPLDFP